MYCTIVFIKLTNELQPLNLKHTYDSLFSWDFLSGMKDTSVWGRTVRVLNSFFLVLWFGGCKSLQASKGVYCLMMEGQASLYDCLEERETKEWVGVCFLVCVMVDSSSGLKALRGAQCTSETWQGLCWRLHYCKAFLFLLLKWLTDKICLVFNSLALSYVWSGQVCALHGETVGYQVLCTTLEGSI